MPAPARDPSITKTTRVEVALVVVLVAAAWGLFRFGQAFDEKLSNHALAIERSFGELRADVRVMAKDIATIAASADTFATKDQLRALELRVEQLEKKGP